MDENSGARHCLIVVIIDLVSSDSVAGTSGAFIFAITPIFAAQGLESSAEPVSNAANSVVIFLLLYLLRFLPRLSFPRSLLALLALTLSIAFAMTVKRENALLLIIVPLLLLTIGQSGISTSLRMNCEPFLDRACCQVRFLRQFSRRTSYVGLILPK